MNSPSSSQAAPVGTRLVLRDASGEREWQNLVSLAPRGAAIVAAQDPEHGCTLALAQGELRVIPGAASDVRCNGQSVPAPRVLQLDDVLRMADVDLVVDRLEADMARLSVYPLNGNVTGSIDAGGVATLPGALEDQEIAVARGLALEASTGSGGSRRVATRWWPAIGLCAVLIVGVLAALALMQRVPLSLVPADASVRAVDSIFSWQAADTLFVFPGQHRLEAHRAGYRRAELRVDVQRGRESRASFRLQKLPGIVQFDTGGVEAQVSVDGVLAGRVPGDLDIEAGLRTLTVRAPRYLDQVVRVDVTGMGERQIVRVALQPSFGVVSVRTNPAGARVFVDDEVLGTTPARLELQSGVRRVRIEAPTMRPWQATIVVQAGATSELGPIDLGAADARLAVRSVPAAADVTVGGIYRGQTPLTLTLAPGIEHAIGVSRAGYETARRNVFAEPAGQSTLDVRLIAQLVTVRIVGEPADAEVFVDGAARGRAPAELRLPATTQRLEIRKSGFETYSVELALAPGLDRTVEYKLLDPRNIAGNAAREITTKSGIALRLVPGGEFLMGAERREQGRRPNEGARRVTLSRPYYIGVTEVTNAQFRKFRPLHNSGFVAQQSLDIDGQAVTGVTWSDAVEFCNWLSQQEGLTPAYVRAGSSWALQLPVGTGYRLPTEAEWEYAARYAGEGRSLRFAWGDALPVRAESGNFAGSESATITTDTLVGYTDPYPVVSKSGQFAANALGLFDMAGNVSEWVNDRYSSLADTVASIDPLGPAEGDARGIRGSNWRSSTAAALRFAWREPASQASDVIGFRVARYVAPPLPAGPAP